MNMKTNIRNITLAAMCLAIGIILPTITMQVPQIGNMLLPMHLPVLLCGFICGWPYGLMIGIITPLLRSVLFTMPPFFPTAIAMAFELGTYGALTGILFSLFKIKDWTAVYGALIPAMVIGRVVWGIIMYILLGMKEMPFTFMAFLNGAILTAIPGIIIQLTILPLVIIALIKIGIIKEK